MPNRTMKILQGISFGIANMVQIIPLIIFMAYFRNPQILDYIPYVLFYTGSKTGLLLINGIGDINNPFRVFNYCLLVYIGMLSVLGLTSNLIITDLAAFFLGISASTILPTYQAVYYRERVVWHWNLGGIEIISMVIYILLTLGSLAVINDEPVQVMFRLLNGFMVLGFLIIQGFPRFVKSKSDRNFLRQTMSTSDIELFIWLTLIVFSFRFLRFFGNRIGLIGLVISIIGFGIFLIKILLKKKIEIDFPWWLIGASFLNGAYETFTMLYILCVAHTQSLILFSYGSYMIGLILAQFTRKIIQHLFYRISNLKFQFIVFIIGSWLITFLPTYFLGIFLISYTGSANSILLNHQVYRLQISTPANRLLIKYRNVYLGSILLQAVFIVCLLGIIFFNKDSLTTLLTTIDSQNLTLTELARHLINIEGKTVAAVLTGATVLLGIWLPGLDENNLFSS